MADEPIVLVDGSQGTSQEKKAELGAVRAQPFAIIESIDKTTNRTKTRDALLEPRNFHFSETDPVASTSSSLKDRRLGLSLISDREHTFGTQQDVTDSISPFANDWDPKNKSTRIVGGEDPRGLTGLVTQIAVPMDVPGGVSTCIPLGPTIAAKDGTKIPAGFVVGAPAPPSGGGGTTDSKNVQLNTAALSTLAYIDPTQTGQGAKGTPSSKLGLRIDANVGDLTNQLYGPLRSDKASSASYTDAGPTATGTAYRGIMLFNDSTKQWEPCLKLPSSGAGSGGSSIYYGDGYHGDVTWDGTTTSPFDPDSSGGGDYLFSDVVQFRQMRRNIYFRNLTINLNHNFGSGAIPLELNPNGYQIFVSNTLTLTGKIAQNDSGNVSPYSTPLHTGDAGNRGLGASGTGSGNAGENVTSYLYNQTFNAGAGNAGAGRGGDADGTWGGGAGGSDVNTHSEIVRTLPEILALTGRFGGAGGGGGGANAGAGSAGGGAGGKGGGIIIIRARHFVGSGSVEAKGGDGTAGGASGGGKAGGGGGGNPGAIIVVSDDVVAGTIPGITFTLTAGVGGAGAGGGAAGANGHAVGLKMFFNPND